MNYICHARFVLFVLFGLTVVSSAAATGIAGTYTGTYSGSDSGTVTISINTYGSAQCVFHSSVRGADYVAFGTATWFTNGKTYVGVNEVPLQQSFLTCATSHFCPPGAFCPAEPIPTEFLGLTGGIYPDGPAATFVGQWFASNGDMGTFTATYSSGVGATDFINPGALTGLWYDPKYTGSGFNITGSTAGLIVTYYGWDKLGNRLWLTSAIGPDQILLGQSITLDLMQTVDGTFAAPAAPSTNTHWGTMTLTFTSCTAATATLNGMDGTLAESLTLLIGFNGLSCQ